MSNIMEIEDILKILPHRYPFMLVDRIIGQSDDGNRIVGLKNLTFNELFFQGHFPNKSIMPGVLIIEAFAQTAALLGAYGFDEIRNSENEIYALVSVDKARFRKPAGPGDQLVLDVKFQSVKSGMWKFSATAYIDSEEVASAELLTTIME